MLARIRRTGFLYSVGIAINRVVPAWLFRFRHFVVYEIDAARLASVLAQKEATANSTIRLSWCDTPQDLKAAEELTYPSSAEVPEDFMIAQAKSGGQIAAALWAVRQQFTEGDLGIQYNLRPNQVWLFAALGAPQFRRQGIYQRVLGFMCDAGQHKFATTTSGDPQFLLCVTPHNIASNRAHQKFAKDVLGQAFSFKLFNVAACFCFGKKLSADSTWTWDAANRPISIRMGSL